MSRSKHKLLLYFLVFDCAVLVSCQNNTTAAVQNTQSSPARQLGTSVLAATGGDRSVSTTTSMMISTTGVALVPSPAASASSSTTGIGVSTGETTLMPPQTTSPINQGVFTIGFSLMPSPKASTSPSSNIKAPSDVTSLNKTTSSSGATPTTAVKRSVMSSSELRSREVTSTSSLVIVQPTTSKSVPTVSASAVMYQQCKPNTEYCRNKGHCFMEEKTASKMYCACGADYYGEKCENKVLPILLPLVYALGATTGFLLLIISCSLFCMCRNSGKKSSADMTFHKELDTYNPSDILRAHGKANAGYEE